MWSWALLLFGPPYRAVDEGGLKHLGIITKLDHQPALLPVGEQIVKGGCEHQPRLPLEYHGDAVLIAERSTAPRDAVAPAPRNRTVRRHEAFQRRKRRLQQSDQGLSLIEFLVAKPVRGSRAMQR